MIVPQSQWTVQWPTNVINFKEQKSQGGVKEVLSYEDVTEASWQDAQGYEWLVFYLYWPNAAAAQIGGVHDPRNCLPASGWALMKESDQILWEFDEKTVLIFNTSVYSDKQGIQLFVFSCQWDPQGYAYNEKPNRFYSDRFRDVWLGNRKEGKQILQLVTTGYATEEMAREAFLQTVNKLIVAGSPK
jgi:hypothetical protein